MMHVGYVGYAKAYCINGEMPEEEIGTRVTVFSGSAAEKREAPTMVHAPKKGKRALGKSSKNCLLRLTARSCRVAGEIPVLFCF